MAASSPRSNTAPKTMAESASLVVTGTLTAPRTLGILNKMRHFTKRLPIELIVGGDVEPNSHRQKVHPL